MNSTCTKVNVTYLKGTTCHMNHFTCHTKCKYYHRPLILAYHSYISNQYLLKTHFHSNHSHNKHTYPRLSASAIYRQLQNKGSISSKQISEARGQKQGGVTGCLHTNYPLNSDNI